MQTVLVVDDSPTDRAIVGRFLQEEPELSVSFACDGNEALNSIRTQLPDIVVTDLQMPDCDGLQLVDQVKQEFPGLPVILMTARGSEDIAAEALRKGAASYVPKRVMASQLRDTVVRVLSAAIADRQRSRLMHSLAECQCRFEIQNDPELIEPLTQQLQEMLLCLPLGDEAERLRVALAVKHMLQNGLYHGNLELPYDVEDLSSPAAVAVLQERLFTDPYANRTLFVEASISPREARFQIRHEGPGFADAAREAKSADPCNPQHFTRGLVLAQSIMDEVTISDDGRSVSIIKRSREAADMMVDDEG
ncbi:MAG TPA: response regulator [Planctomycetaceae bacterium]|nr:response regulator [Planctomycetaceae bacterium]